MVATLPDKFQKFANWSGAKLRPEKKEADAPLEVEMPNFVSDSDVEPAQAEAPTDELVQSKFERNTAPWKNPKITLGTVIALAAAITGIGFFALNSNFKWPTLGGPTLGNSTANNNDMEPVDHPDGKVETAALTGNLGQGLDQDANTPNPFTTKQKPTASASKAIPTKDTVAKVLTPSTPSTPIHPTATASAIPMSRRTVSNPTYTDYDSPALRTYPRASSTVAYAQPSNVGYSRPLINTTPALPSTSTRSISSVTTPAVPQMSAADRRQAAIASTSTMGGTTDKSTAVQATTVAQTPQTQSYQEAVYLPSETAVLDGVPQQLINRSQKAVGRLLMGVAFIPGDTAALNGQSVEVAIDNPLQSGLPAGSRIEATVDFPSAGGQLKSAVLHLTPKAIVIGDAEYPLPADTVILTGQNGQPLIAKRQGSEFLRGLGSAAKTVLGATVGGLSSIALGNGTGILSGLGGGLNALGSLSRPASPQTATEVLALRENTAIQVNIVKPLSLPLAQGSSESALPTDQAFFPLSQPSQRLSYREPSDAELQQLIQPQTESDSEQHQSVYLDSPDNRSEHQPESQPESQPEQPQVQPQPIQPQVGGKNG